MATKMSSAVLSSPWDATNACATRSRLKLVACDIRLITASETSFSATLLGTCFACKTIPKVLIDYWPLKQLTCNLWGEVFVTLLCGEISLLYVKLLDSIKISISYFHWIKTLMSESQTSKLKKSSRPYQTWSMSISYTFETFLKT